MNIALDVMLLHVYVEGTQVVPYLQIIMVTWLEYAGIGPCFYLQNGSYMAER